VVGRLKPSIRPTMIDPGVPSPETDLCSNLAGLQQHLARPGSAAHPLFAYFAPMNVHLINTRHEGRAATTDQDYPGFYSPYASRLRRIDACFGDFVSYLKREGRYDDSIIVVTSDHGDSLGEEGIWGHAFWLFPEDIRVPLLVRIPSSLKPQVTTDLTRIAFSADIAPTLYGLLHHDVSNPGAIFGAPLFVPRGEDLPPRRRESYLVTSSYAPTYGLLRRNGRSLYVSDLFERKEFAFDLGREPIGTQILVDQATRRVNQRLIRERVSELGAFFGKTAAPPAAAQTLTHR
jgi:arylsulfatase A-like enzyme